MNIIKNLFFSIEKAGKVSKEGNFLFRFLGNFGSEEMWQYWGRLKQDDMFKCCTCFIQEKDLTEEFLDKELISKS